MVWKTESSLITKLHNPPQFFLYKKQKASNSMYFVGIRPWWQLINIQLDSWRLWFPNTSSASTHFVSFSQLPLFIYAITLVLIILYGGEKWKWNPVHGPIPYYASQYLIWMQCRAGIHMQASFFTYICISLVRYGFKFHPFPANILDANFSDSAPPCAPYRYKRKTKRLIWMVTIGPLKKSRVTFS